MRNFSIGFACGVLVLAIVLWATGGLRTNSHPVARPAAPQEASREMPATFPPLPDTSRPVPAAPLNLPDAGDAARPPQLLFPVPGVDPRKVVDTFSQGRSGGRAHEAIDIMAPRGTPVLAVDEGNVAKLFQSKEGGNTVYQFDNSRTWCYYYAHLDRYADGLKEGTLLRRGDVLGYVGSTGDASAEAPHLHFALFKLGPGKQWWQGTPVNPYPLLTGSAPK